MKKFFLLISAIAMCVGINAQTFGEMEKSASKEVREKAVKTARKQAKKDAKEGWTIAPGQLPLDKQYDEYYTMLYMEDGNGTPYYVTGEAMSVGSTYDAAQLTATTLAKGDLAGKIQTDVASLVQASVANEQISQEEAVSLSRVISESKNLIVARLTSIRQPILAYRKTASGDIEVRTIVAYSSNDAKQAVKASIKEGLERAGEELRADLDYLLGI